MRTFWNGDSLNGITNDRNGYQLNLKEVMQKLYSLQKSGLIQLIFTPSPDWTVYKKQLKLSNNHLQIESSYHEKGDRFELSSQVSCIHL